MNISPEILNLFLSNEKLDKDVNIGRIASQTPYYSGSDLKSKFLFPLFPL